MNKIFFRDMAIVHSPMDCVRHLEITWNRNSDHSQKGQIKNKNSQEISQLIQSTRISSSSSVFRIWFVFEKVSSPPKNLFKV